MAVDPSQFYRPGESAPKLSHSFTNSQSLLLLHLLPHHILLPPPQFFLILFLYRYPLSSLSSSLLLGVVLTDTLTSHKKCLGKVEVGDWRDWNLCVCVCVCVCWGVGSVGRNTFVNTFWFVVFCVSCTNIIHIPLSIYIYIYTRRT